MAGRIGAGILVTCYLLLPSALSAQEARPRFDEPSPAEDAAGRSPELLARELEELEQRVEELETTQTASEDATRSIIRESLSTLGAKINEFVTLGGVAEVLVGRGEGFPGTSENEILLNTLELDFEIQVNDWTLGSMIVALDDGANFRFPTTEGDEISIERFNVDTAFVTLGNTRRFPPFGRFGRMIVPFGISTGNPVADVLNLDDPLTVSVFETRENAMLVGFEFPTPPLTRPVPPSVTPPPVRPLLLAPLVRRVSESLGFRPFPRRPTAPPAAAPPPAPPPFRAAAYFYNGDSDDKSNRQWHPTRHFGATLGYRKKVMCRPYRSQESRAEDAIAPEPRLPWVHVFCPWSIDVAVDFNRSVFDSRFLEFEYRSYLGQIGFVAGMAGSIKSTLGPVGLVAEWNGAIESARFVNDLGQIERLKPSAWQVSLNYQFDWNPWVQAIGAQGTYLALGYSESLGLAGVTRLIAGVPTRVGTVPRRRFLVSVGEWVLDGVRVAVEYSYKVDYPRKRGGTGDSANGIFAMFTYEW